jgi:hypothetical protein
MKFAFLIVLFVLLAIPCVADTHNASTCSYSDVSAQVSAAADGDIVSIPSGSCTWTSNLTITDKILTIQGAGIDSTVITDGVSKADYPNVPQVLFYHTKSGGPTRITGITFQGGSATDSNNKGSVWIEGSSDQFRLDHCSFITTQTAGLMVYNVVGVVDHNLFTLTNFKYGIYVHHNSWGEIGDFGDNSWAQDTNLGSSSFIFVEDNTFSGSDLEIAIDGWNGSRVVFRHNSLTNAAFENHGTDTPGRWRSQRAFEVYSNTISYTNMNWASMIGIRGGTGVIYDNVGTTSGSGSTNHVADTTCYRSSDHGRAYDPWGQCDGTNAWDQNSDGNGYACLDQPGRGKGTLLANYTPTPTGWPTQSLEPMYVWNNTLNGNADTFGNGATLVIQLNRDYYNSSKPGYVAYTYPHPLQGGADTTDPTVAITSPTSSPTYATSVAAQTISGTCTDDVGCTAVTYSCDNTASPLSGTATGTANWTQNFTFSSGATTCVFTGVDAAANDGTDQIVVTYTPAEAGNGSGSRTRMRR